MRLTRLFAICVVVAAASVATIVSCGGGTSPQKTPDAKVFLDSGIDAPAQVVNALGQLCPFAAGGGGTACPAGNACVKVTGVGTNANTGYCTPDCMNMSSICTTGYTGPAGGMPQCALTAGSGSMPNGCAIVCTTGTQCGTGLSCIMLPPPNQTIKICVPT